MMSLMWTCVAAIIVSLSVIRADELTDYTDTLVSLDGHNLTVESSETTRPSMESKHSSRSSDFHSQHVRPQQQPSAFPVPSRVKLDSRSRVNWVEDGHIYAMQLQTSDTRFQIRLSPPPERGSPWPMPQLYQPTNVTFRVAGAAAFEFHSVGEPCQLLDEAFRRFTTNVFGEDAAENSHHAAKNDAAAAAAATEIHSVNVTVLKECIDYPYLNMDESYDLEIKRTGASIITREVWGALRGLETLSQLIYYGTDGHLWVNKTYIRDYPRFPHRGILLDTSRHYISKETILANLEAMAFNKMNVFHWHIVDDQSFPFQSKAFPNLSDFGAYNARTHIYTHEDVAEIIEAARIRGIRVIPEFDTPGHMFSWGLGQDYLLTPCYDYRREPNGLFGPVNPILRKTYTFLRSLFKEILSVFKDKYIHIGGDEVPLDCWQSNPFLVNFMKRNNMSDIKDLLSLYEQELLKIISDLGEHRDMGSGYIVWQELFDSGITLKPETIVQIWKGDYYDISRITNAGLRTIFSKCWYLDFVEYGIDWDKFYTCQEMGVRSDVYNDSLLLGGEACLWTEFADDDSVMPRLWPRAAAAAERLWSSRDVTNVHQAAPRIEEQRCRMLRRGLHVGVLSGPGYCSRHKPRRRRAKSHVTLSDLNIALHVADNNENSDLKLTSELLVKPIYLVQLSSYPIVLTALGISCFVLFLLTKLVLSIRRSAAGSKLLRQRLACLFVALVGLAIGCYVCMTIVWMHDWLGVHTQSVPPTEADCLEPDLTIERSSTW